MDIAALVSGGVDSSVALHRAARQAAGRLRAYYLKIWLEDELSFLGSCPWEEDLSYAREVCRSAGVDLEVVPLQREYYERVVSYTVSELRAGRTPSPDIFCNQQIKFGAFLDAIGGEADQIVTGHYARVVHQEGTARLMRAPDPVKDQTYFLSHLSPTQLAKTSFPIGELTKAEVRSQAAELNLPNQERPDSQGICFLGKIPYRQFVRHYLGERPGQIVEADSGRVLGEHRGVWFYTIGQRQGLGLSGGPWYVVERDFDANLVRVASAVRAPALARSEMNIGAASWLTGRAPLEPGESDRFLVKLRHGPRMTGATITRLQAPVSGEDIYRVELEEPDRGVAAGQFAVIYRGEECLGGAAILEEGLRCA